jgi:DNA-binding NtrC family response regulator
VEEKRFREDLFYRINVIRIDVPPLRARGTDVLLLAQTFIAHFSKGRASTSGKRLDGLASAAAEKLMAYPWARQRARAAERDRAGSRADGPRADRRGRSARKTLYRRLESLGFEETD